jgi:2-keto-3-deoxy-L-fuconate dehydrogenase
MIGLLEIPLHGTASSSMTGKLDGKTALITGAGQGIGRATAELFAAESARVIATDLDPGKLEGFPCFAARELDVRDGAAVHALANEIGTIDVLFNCAGIVPNGTVLESTDEDWAQTFDVNVTSMARMIRAFLPGMIGAGHGAIVNVASVAGSIKGVLNRCAYGASKAAVIGLTKSVAVDFVTKGIRCNAICPGTVDSPSLRQRWKDTGDYEGARKAFIARQPMGRLGTTAEIAELALYLAGDGAAFVTGQTFIIDGAMAL